MSLILDALAGAAVAFAPPPAAEPTAVDQVVVTARSFVVDQAASATKTETPILETPQAISVVDADFIETLNVRTVAEALNYTSGVRSQAVGSDTRIDYYQLRGFLISNFFKDGLVLYNSGAFLSWTTPAEGVERLEVLKGPSSVLYGSAGAGGLVNIVSKGPVSKPLLRAEVGGDEFGTGYGSLDVGGGVGPVDFRGVGLIRRGDTQADYAQDNRSYGMAAMGLQITPDARLTLRASYQSDRSNRPTGFIPYAGSVTPLPDGRRIPATLFVSDPRVDQYDRDQLEGSYVLEQRLGEHVRFVSNGRYASLDLTYAGLFGLFTGNPVPSGSSFLLYRSNSLQVGDLQNLTFDHQLIGDFTTGPVAHTVLAGLDYSRSTLTNAVKMGAAPPLDIFAPTYTAAIPALGAFTRNGQKLAQTGLYLQEQAKWRGLVLLLSGRHDEVAVSAVSNAGLLVRGSPDRFSYRAGLVYVSPWSLAPYVSYATSFTPLVGTQAATGNFYNPETGRQVEAGLRYEARSFPLLATLSVFDIRRDGVLIADPRAGFPTNQSQGGQQRSKGAEFEVQAKPLPTLNLTASITGFDLDVVSVTPATAATLGKTPTQTPEFIAGAFADYVIPSGSLAGLGGGFGVRHTGKSYANDVNTLVVPGVTVLDAAFHYDWSRFRLALNVSNLLDESFVAACPAAGTCYVGNLRRATVSLKYRM